MATEDDMAAEKTDQSRPLRAGDTRQRPGEPRSFTFSVERIGVLSNPIQDEKK